MAAFITKQERLTRLANLRAFMRAEGLNAVILTPGSNLRYITGLSWGETERLVCAVIDAEHLTYICPKFEDTALLASIQISGDFAYWEEHESPHDLLARHVSGKTIALDPNCTFGQAAIIAKQLAPAELIAADEIMTTLRGQKSEAEIALIKAAMQITLKVHQDIARWIKPGMKSSEVKAEIDRLHRAAGADNGSYFCAVQFGEASSHPHGVPGDPVLKDGEIILIDTGCTLDGYHSDITRTYALEKMPGDVETVWAAEKHAQQAAFDHAQLGTPCGDVDRAAREVLSKYGYGPDYTLPGLPHRTGHGIGLDIHEGPYLVRNDRTPLAPGMCFSNEPMIVLPGQYGIRLEDHFYMTDNGPEWFTEPQPSLYQV